MSEVVGWEWGTRHVHNDVRTDVVVVVAAAIDESHPLGGLPYIWKPYLPKFQKKLLKL
jgi:hypothetical protein